MEIIAAPGCFPILANRQPFRLRRIERFERALSEFALNDWNDWNGAPLDTAPPAYSGKRILDTGHLE